MDLPLIRIEVEFADCRVPVIREFLYACIIRQLANPKLRVSALNHFDLTYQPASRLLKHAMVIPQEFNWLQELKYSAVCYHSELVCGSCGNVISVSSEVAEFLIQTCGKCKTVPSFPESRLIKSVRHWYPKYQFEFKSRLLAFWATQNKETLSCKTL